MKKTILFIFCLLTLLTTACKKQRSELIVSEIRTLNAIKNPGIKEEFPINQKVPFMLSSAK